MRGPTASRVTQYISLMSSDGLSSILDHSDARNMPQEDQTPRWHNLTNFWDSNRQLSYELPGFVKSILGLEPEAESCPWRVARAEKPWGKLANAYSCLNRWFRGNRQVGDSYRFQRRVLDAHSKDWGRDRDGQANMGLESFIQRYVALLSVMWLTVGINSGMVWKKLRKSGEDVVCRGKKVRVTTGAWVWCIRTK